MATLTELKSALIFIGQAQAGAKPQSPLWNEIGKLYEEVDSMIEALEEGTYEGQT